jgi:hypothetical protein
MIFIVAAETTWAAPVVSSIAHNRAPVGAPIVPADAFASGGEGRDARTFAPAWNAGRGD